MDSAAMREFPWFTTVLAALATWRLTHLLNAEEGPWQCFHRLRELAAVKGGGNVFGCFYCLSLWTSIPFALLLASDWHSGILLWFGLSGAAILMERVTKPTDERAIWWHDPAPSATGTNNEKDPEVQSDVLLRQ